MQIIKCLIFALILQTRVYPAEVVIPTSDISTTSLVKGFVKIVTSCYGDRIKGVVLAGNLPDTLARTLSGQHLIPTIVIDHVGLSEVPRFKSQRILYKLDVFLIAVSSGRQFYKIVKEAIITSMWWNPMASYFIIDLSPSCTYQIQLLMVAFQLNVLNAKVMCYHRKSRGHIFAYNPYKNEAPVPWRYFTVRPQPGNNHPFTLFRQKYERNEAICVNLDFVKTNDFGGYEIRVEGFSRALTAVDANWLDLNEEKAQWRRLFHIIFGALNVVPKFSETRPKYPLMAKSEMSIMYCAIQMNNVATTYPYNWFNLVFVSKYRGHKSQLEKILYVVDFDSRLGMGIVYLVTLIFFKFFVRQALGLALLNLVRATCNTGFRNLPENNAPRMYLTGLLFFVLTMQGIYQGNLATLLTTKIPVRNVNSVEDIVKWGYKVYYPETLDDTAREMFAHADLKEPYTETKSNVDCLAHTLNDSSAVCMVLTAAEVFDITRWYDLHMSDSIQQVPVGIVIRRSWRLTQNVNRLLKLIVEADIMERWERRCHPTKLTDFKFDKEVRENVDFKSIVLAEVSFAFFILGIGLLCATVTFVVEVAIYRYQHHKNNTVIVLYARYNHDSSVRASFECADRTSENTVSVIQPPPTNQSTNESASRLSRTSIVTSALR